MRPRIYFIVASCVFGSWGAFSRGYLPAIGPTPLRFQTPPPAVVIAALPALQIPPLAATNDHAAAESPPAPADVVLVAPLTPNQETNLTVTNSVLLPPNEPVGLSVDSPTNRVSVQSLVEFFRRDQGGTNHTGTSVYLPLNFVPPNPGPPPSSSATYSSP